MRLRRRSVGLCTALALAVCAARALATDAAASEEPVQERVADAPPAGLGIAPGLTFSGYATAQFLSPDGAGGAQPTLAHGRDVPAADSQYSRRARLNLSHLSGIVWWEPAPAWKVLGEIDLQDVVQLPGHRDAEDGPFSSRYAALDRLYVDYRLTDSLTLRAGKFLTPIGGWNQEHSDPQTWTVLRPLISQSAFPTSATGLMLSGSTPVAAQWIDYQVYASDGGEWRTSPRTQQFDHAFGGRVSTALDPDLQVGLSFSRFVQGDYAPLQFDLAGIDMAWTWRRAEFSGEAIVRRTSEGGTGTEYGWFVQAAVPLVDRWWAVGRLEEYKRAQDTGERQTALAGVVYRSGRHWVFKAEWVQASDGSAGLPSGFLSSLTLVY